MTRLANYTDYILWTNNTSEANPSFEEFRRLTVSELQTIATIVDRWKE